MRRQPQRRLSNADLAELLARESETASGILVRAFRRAARSAFLWPEHAADLLAQNRSLTELHSVGPFMAKQIERWIEKPPPLSRTARPLRRDSFALAEVRKLLNASPGWSKQLRGDLQMHASYSDGFGAIREMVDAGRERGYDYIAITDHSKGLKIAGGIDEKMLTRQAAEIARANARPDAKVTVFGNVYDPITPVTLESGQRSCPAKCVPKLSLGTRGERGLTGRITATRAP